MSKMYTKYTEEHYKKLAEFKKSLEEKFNVSVDSIVTGILDTKSATEIKDLLKVDIDKVSCKTEVPVSTTAKYEQCMHCGKLFFVNSPPGLCVQCLKPRDEKSLEATTQPETFPLEPPRQPIAPPSVPLSFPSAQWPIMPPGPMPMMPSVTPMITPQGTMPPFPLSSNISGMTPSISEMTPVNPQSALYYPPSYSNMQHMQAYSYTNCAQPPLPTIRGHTLLPPGCPPPEHLFAINQKINPSEDRKSNGLPVIVIPDDEKTETNHDSVSAPETSSDPVSDIVASRPDPQSFDVPVESSTSEKKRPVFMDHETSAESLTQFSSKNPSDLMKTLVTRN